MAPKIVDKSEKKAAILQAAMKQFARKGVSAAKMSDIAAEAGIGKGTIYEYFPTKESLFQESFCAFYASMDEELTKIVRSGLRAAEKLEKLLRTSITLIVENDPDFARVMMEYWAEGIRKKESGPENLNLVALYEEYRNLLVEVIEEGIAGGEFRPLSPLPLASLIIGVLDGLYLQWFLDDEVIDPDDAVNTLLSLLHGGMYLNKQDGEAK
jgi:TetR/AcrR family fatty acid metabolism transcriptional regulator